MPLFHNKVKKKTPFYSQCFLKYKKNDFLGHHIFKFKSRHKFTPPKQKLQIWSQFGYGRGF